MYFPMKQIAYLILSVVVGSALASSSAVAEEKKAEKAEAKASSSATAESKMTKQQAEKAVLKKYTNAKVIRSDMKTVNGKSGWVVKFTRTGGNVAEQVMVDDAGKLTHL